jgi:TolB-like protein
VQCIRELRDRLGDDEHRLIKTVHRRGYLLDAPATVGVPQQSLAGAWARDTEPVPTHAGRADRLRGNGGLPVGSRDWRGWTIGSTILLLTLLTAAALATTMRSRPLAQAERPVAAAPSPRLSLVVLPFQNLDADPEQEYFADAITDDLTNGVSRLGVMVIARSTASAYKGKTIDVRQVGSELGVRYVVEGTVRRAGGEVRVIARVADATTAANVWSETFDIDRQHLARLRDDFTARLGRFLNVELIHAMSEQSLQERRHNPEAVDFLMRAHALSFRTPRGEDVTELQRLYREALQRDDMLADAWIGLSFTHLRNVRFSPTHEQDLLHASAAAKRGIALNPRTPFAHLAMGWVLYESKRMDQALAAFEHAVVLNPNLPFAHASVAAGNLMLGRPENVFEPLRKAIRLSPRDAGLPMWQVTMGAAYLALERDAEAIDSLNRSVASNPRDPFSRMFLASALGLSGREVEANTQIAELRGLIPGFTIGQFKAAEPSDAPAFRMQRERVYEGLRRAGLSE